MKQLHFLFLSILCLFFLVCPALADEFIPIVNFSAIGTMDAIAQAPGMENQTTFDSITDWKPRVDDRYVTWVQYNVNGKIWYYDSKTGKRDIVSNTNGDQNDPDIANGVIVWEDNRKGQTDIYSYDLKDGTECTVWESGTNKQHPAISNNQMVVFEDFGNSDTRNIEYKKIGSTADPVKINENGRDKAYPDIDQDWIVYQQLDDEKSNWNIYAYNISTNQTVQITKDESTHQKPRISGNLVVWEDNRFNRWSIFMYDLKKEMMTEVTYDDLDDREPSISGNNIVWTRYQQDGSSDIYMVNLQIPKTYRICLGNGSQINPDIYIDKVAWQDNRLGNWDIFLYTLQPNTPFRSYEFYGPVNLNFNPAPVGTEIMAKVNGITRDTITVTQPGYYGGSGSMADKLKVDIIQADIGKSITFWSDGYQGSPSVPITGNGDTRELPLNFTFSPPLPDLQFYGSLVVNGQAAPAGTIITAKIDNDTRGSITTTQGGQYGGAGQGDPALAIAITQADLGKHVTFWVDGCQALESYQITTGGKFRQDLTFATTPTIQPYEFYGYVTTGGVAAPAGTTIIAQIDNVQKTTYVTRYVGSYGSPGTPPEDPRLIVPVQECDIGKTITFWMSGTLQASETQTIARSGERIVHKDLTFSSSPSGIVADFTATPTSGTAPLTVQFTDKSTGSPTMWAWDFGDGIIPMNASCSGTSCPNIASPTHTYTQPGNYTVRLTVSNQTGASDTKIKTGYITVTQAGGIVADFNATPTSGAAPLTVQFTDKSTGSPTMWAWDFGDGIIPMNASCSGTSCPNIASPTHTYTQPGNYTVRLTASNQTGASDTKVKEHYITVLQPGAIHADFNATPTSGTAPLAVQFTDKSTGSPTMWAWNFGDGIIPMNASCSGTSCPNIASPTHTYTKPGSYTVSLTASSVNSSDTAVKANYISVTNGSTQGIPIKAGWNFVSVPKKLLPGSDTASIFSSIDVDGHSIFQFDAVTGQWKTLNSQSPIKPLDSVWIYSKNSATVPLSYDSDPLKTPPTKELKKGWNAVGFTGSEPLDAKFTFLSIQEKWINCLGYNADLQRYADMIIKGHNDDSKLTPYSGYWLFMSDDGILAAISA